MAEACVTELTNFLSQRESHGYHIMREEMNQVCSH